ncbi:hypothetical protein EVAR_96235_1 [Eumeta japonica]|uniref:Uncharacterized protein n=1 Tax=Eumeta variegata TaxID=151549 RepID=A0A4C1WMV9_EUMVA|nr:hypothetical protein EVAR_96235_1 [Eumeta japonica]
MDYNHCTLTPDQAMNKDNWGTSEKSFRRSHKSKLDANSDPPSAMPSSIESSLFLLHDRNENFNSQILHNELRDRVDTSARAQAVRSRNSRSFLWTKKALTKQP